MSFQDPFMCGDKPVEIMCFVEMFSPIRRDRKNVERRNNIKEMQNPWGITKKNKTARHPESTVCPIPPPGLWN